MVRFLAVSVVLLAFVTSFGQRKPFDPGKFPRSWELLTTVNNQPVIFQPCDAPNHKILITESDTGFSLTDALGQISDQFTIQEMTTSDGKAFTLKVDPGPLTFSVNVLDADFRVARWSRSSSAEEDYVNSTYSGEYPVVKQPCRECWPEEQCQAEEKNQEAPISYKIEKVNEVSQDKSLSDFVARLQSAISQKDKSYLLSVVDPDIEISFGDEKGIEAFTRNWKPEVKDSPIWYLLGKLISLGGTFVDVEGAPKSTRTNFVFPYIYTATLPDAADPYSAMVITGANVNLREGPGKTAKVLGQLSFDVVKADLEHSAPFQTPHPAVRQYEWYKVTTLDDKSTGFVYGDYVWSPIDYRMFLKKKQGQWKITVLVEGD